jgi:hypothetical protein
MAINRPNRRNAIGTATAEALATSLGRLEVIGSCSCEDTDPEGSLQCLLMGFPTPPDRQVERPYRDVVIPIEDVLMTDKGKSDDKPTLMCVTGSNMTSRR